MLSKNRIPTFIIVLLVIFFFPICIALVGGIFGLVARLFGALLGIVGALFGWFFNLHWWLFDGFFQWNIFTVLFVVFIVVLISRRRRI